MGYRLLFLTQTYPRFEGDTSGPFIRDLARGLVRRGHQVTVLAPHARDLPTAWEDGGVAVETFRYAPQAWEVLGYSRSLDSDETVRAAAGAVAPLYALGARWALGRMLRRSAFDLLHAHWVVPNGLVARPFARRIPLAVGLHGSDVFLAERREVRPWVRRALARTALLTGCSPELVRRVCALGFPPHASRVIPYGVDGQQFSPDPARRGAWRRRLGIPEDGVLALSVGRMVTKKGFPVLLGAADDLLRRHPRFHLVLAGGGDRLEELRVRMASWEGRVHFPGVVLRDTLPDLYRAADLFVLPAVHDARGNVDGLPNVVLEAMASALPVVASGISGIPLAVRDGLEGLLVPERDEAALGDALETLLTEPEKRVALGRRARRRALEELSWDAVAGRYAEAYETVLGGEAAARA